MATFQELLKAKNKQSNPTNNGPTIDRQNSGEWIVTPAPIQNYEPVQINVRCERVLDRNRLDLFFSAKPSEETRQLLRDQGFRCDIDRNFAWYHKDCLVNRMFLASTFDLPDLMQDIYNDDVKPVEETKPVYDCDSQSSPEFNKYRNQVDQLLEHLKIRPADLMLRAIDCLYTSTFKVN